MPETQGRGSYSDEGRIERAAKRAHESGGSDSAISNAAREAGLSVTREIQERIRQKIRELFGR